MAKGASSQTVSPISAMASPARSSSARNSARVTMRQLVDAIRSFRQVFPDKPQQPLPVLVRHQHVQHGDGINEIEPLWQLVLQAVQHAEPFPPPGILLPAESNRRRRNIRRRQTAALSQQEGRIPALAAADLKHGRIRRDVLLLQGLRHHRRRALAKPFQAAFMHLPVAQVIGLVVLLHRAASLMRRAMRSTTSRSSIASSHSAGITPAPSHAPMIFPAIAPVESLSPSWVTAAHRHSARSS